MSEADLLERPCDTIDEARRVICALGRRFYELGWVSGTGGGISIRVGDRVVMAPSGAQKELLQVTDLFVLDREGAVIEPPQNPALRVSQCKPLFLAAMNLRGAGAVIHTHSKSALFATLAFSEHVTLKKLEMMKGLTGVGYDDTHRVPVIHNTAHESDLADSLSAAIRDNPQAHAVLVRRHGMYVWGQDWIEAKRHAECYDYLLDVAVRMLQMGIQMGVRS